MLVDKAQSHEEVALGFFMLCAAATEVSLDLAIGFCPPPAAFALVIQSARTGFLLVVEANIQEQDWHKAVLP